MISISIGQYVYYLVLCCSIMSQITTSTTLLVRRCSLANEIQLTCGLPTLVIILGGRIMHSVSFLT